MARLNSTVQTELDLRNLHLVDHVSAQLKVYIQPAYANQVLLGVKKELDTHVLRFMEDQQAVLLGYRNVKVVSKQALLTAYMPYLTIECTAELLLFKPTIGNVLVGRVHSLSPGQLNVLVMGGINACVTEGELPEGFRFDVDYNCWVRHGDYSHAILVGDIVACKVLSAPLTDIDQEEVLFNLDATLLSRTTGLLQQQPPLQQQRRAQLVKAIAAETATAEAKAAKAAKKAAKQGAAAAGDEAAQQEEAAAAKAARKAQQAAGKEAASADHKSAKRKQQDHQEAQPPAKKQRHGDQQQQQQQQGQQQQLPQDDAAQAAGSSNSGHSSAEAQQQQQQQQSSKANSKHKHKDKHRDKGEGGAKRKDKSSSHKEHAA